MSCFVLLCALWLAGVGIQQGLTPPQCIVIEDGEGNELPDVPTGRSCKESDDCYRVGAIPGYRYRCESVGAFGITTIEDGRVRYIGTLHDPNELALKFPDQPRQILRRGNDYLSKVTQENTRLPFGHPEAFIEAFANVYLAAAKAIACEVEGKKQPKDLDFPTVDDGVEGMAFIETAVKSSKSKAKWTKFAKT